MLSEAGQGVGMNVSEAGQGVGMNVSEAGYGEGMNVSEGLKAELWPMGERLWDIGASLCSPLGWEDTGEDCWGQ